ncbi:MAG: efflux RND transporter periplasmic adaptor subunit [Gammaproteobacteria bacterium]
MQKFKLIKLLLLTSICIFSLNSVEAKEIKAKLNWYNLTKLSFRVNGIVSSIKVKPGDVVKSNQKLIELDQREYIDKSKITKALKKLRKSEQDEAKRELDRALELYDRTVLSEHELQLAKNAYILSATNFLTADTNWNKAKRDLEFSQISAPFDSIILSVRVNEFETIVSSFESKPAMIIADATKISAQFLLTNADYNNISNKTSAVVIIDGLTYKGALRFKSLIPDHDMFPVAVVFSVPKNAIGKKFISGMDAIVKIK